MVLREPVEIRIFADCIEIINQGGPDRSVKMGEIKTGIIHNRRYRNRRIGDFLKELDMTEDRGTGIPIIRKEVRINGSPEPRFETDDNYSYFITTLPIHPAFYPNEAINEATKSALGGIVEVILNQPGINRLELIKKSGKSKTSIERYLRILKENNFVNYQGSKKTGGYHLTDEAKQKLK